jgi:hypothetical protein
MGSPRPDSDPFGPDIAGTPTVHEAAIREAFDQLPERQLADLASSTLAEVLDKIGADAALWRSLDEPSRLQAAMVGGIRAFRAIRAGMAVLANGYEMEADTMSRILLELYVQTREALEDSSGETARIWLTGQRGRGIGGRVRAAMHEKPTTYGALSRAAHGDPRALVGLAVVDDGQHVVEWGPSQTPATARCLVGFAIGARDMAVLLEDATGLRFSAITALDQVLVANVPGWRPDADSPDENETTAVSSG